jgi:hypothetical protein
LPGCLGLALENKQAPQFSKPALLDIRDRLPRHPKGLADLGLAHAVIVVVLAVLGHGVTSANRARIRASVEARTRP